MPQVNTARGPIDTSGLGVTLMHEHVFIMTTEVMQNYPEQWGDDAAREADAVERLNQLKAAGVDTIVDLTVIGLGRYIPRIARPPPPTSTSSWPPACTPLTTCRSASIIWVRARR